MSFPIRNLRAASEEFADAVGWYEEQQPGLGAEFFDCVVQATSLIQARPEIGSLDSNRRTRRILVQRFPYQVVYSLTPDEIVILAIAHLKRRPGYWKSRE